MIYNKYGVFFSVFILLLILVSIFFNFKPQSILPKKYFLYTNFVLFKIVVYVLIASILLFPLDLQFLSDKKVVSEKLLPIQIVFDVSLSMAADDMLPSRFQVAKNSLIKLISKLDGYNISMITFSGIPFVYIPFSSDTKSIISKLEKTNLGDFPPTQDFIGTAIGDALLLGVNNLNKLNNNISYPGLIILITDGDSNKGYDPLQVIDIVKKKNVPVFSVGLGDSDYRIGYDKWGGEVKTSINTSLLKKISDITNGEFYMVLKQDNFDEFFGHIKDIVKSQEQQKIKDHYVEINKYILYIIYVCLFFLLYVYYINFKKLPINLQKKYN